MRDLTPLIIVAMPPLLGLLDVVLFRLWGNEATFSWVLLGARASRPLVALATAYSLGLLCGHCFNAVVGDPPPTFEVVARMVVLLSPTLYAMVIIGAGNGAAERHRQALEAGGQLVFSLYVVLAYAAGYAAGMCGLPQHLSPV